MVVTADLVAIDQITIQVIQLHVPLAHIFPEIKVNEHIVEGFDIFYKYLLPGKGKEGKIH